MQYPSLIVGGYPVSISSAEYGRLCFSFSYYDTHIGMLRSSKAPIGEVLADLAKMVCRLNSGNAPKIDPKLDPKLDD